MNQIEKFLKALTAEQRQHVEAVIRRIVSKDLANLDIKKLKGRGQEYRVRIGRVRIRFVMGALGIRILTVEWRDSKTY